MKNLTSLTLLLCCGAASAFLPLSLSLAANKDTTTPTVLHFDLSQIKPMGGGLQSLTFYYGGTFNNIPNFSFSERRDLMQEQTLKLDDGPGGGVTLLGTQFNGFLNNTYQLMDINPVPSHYVTPEKPVCDLDRKFIPGTYNIVLGAERAYTKYPDGSTQFAYAYWLTCSVTKVS